MKHKLIHQSVGVYLELKKHKSKYEKETQWEDPKLPYLFFLFCGSRVVERLMLALLWSNTTSQEHFNMPHQTI